ncbi:hypothetical protein [Methylobacterium sp. JK268]
MWHRGRGTRVIKGIPAPVVKARRPRSGGERTLAEIGRLTGSGRIDISRSERGDFCYIVLAIRPEPHRMPVLEELPSDADISKKQNYLLLEKTKSNSGEHYYAITGTITNAKHQVSVRSAAANFEAALALAKHLADRLDAAFIYIKDEDV